VLERADTMNDEAANTLLKTLEEPPSYVVLLLLSDRPSQVLPTISSRCQPVRFDPLPADRLAAKLQIDLAPARLSLGDAEKAIRLAREPQLRAAAEAFAQGPAADKPWRAILAAAGERANAAREQLERTRDEELEMLPVKDRRRRASEYDDRIRRAMRRASTETIDHALQLAGLWFRDLACVAGGAPELVHNVDRELATDRDPAALRRAVELVEDTRARLALNVSEELALEALAYRLEEL
jgi:DNA polymerase III subunit delta'